MDCNYFPNALDEANYNSDKGSIMRKNWGEIADNYGNKATGYTPWFNRNIDNKFLGSKNEIETYCNINANNTGVDAAFSLLFANNTSFKK